MEKKTVEREKTKLEKIQGVVIVILSLIIVFGLAYFVPELKNCEVPKLKEVSLVDITVDDYKALLNGEEVSFIYLASPHCGYCQQQKPVMEEFMRKYDFDINYLNTSSIDNEEADEVYKLYGSVQEERYGEKGLRTPTMLLVQKGKLLDMNLGNLELNGLVKFIEKYTTINAVEE